MGEIDDAVDLKIYLFLNEEDAQPQAILVRAEQLLELKDQYEGPCRMQVPLKEVRKYLSSMDGV